MDYSINMQGSGRGMEVVREGEGSAGKELRNVDDKKQTWTVKYSKRRFLGFKQEASRAEPR